jgi:hypothetical protein
MTVFSAAWGTRGRGRRRDSLPEGGEEGGWRCSGRRYLPGHVEVIVSLWKKRGKISQGDAHGHGYERGTNSRRSCTLPSPESSADDGGHDELRRAITQHPSGYFVRELRGKKGRRWWGIAGYI